MHHPTSNLCPACDTRHIPTPTTHSSPPVTHDDRQQHQGPVATTLHSCAQNMISVLPIHIHIHKRKKKRHKRHFHFSRTGRLQADRANQKPPSHAQKTEQDVKAAHTRHAHTQRLPPPHAPRLSREPNNRGFSRQSRPEMPYHLGWWWDKQPKKKSRKNKSKAKAKQGESMEAATSNRCSRSERTLHRVISSWFDLCLDFDAEKPPPHPSHPTF